MANLALLVLTIPLGLWSCYVAQVLWGWFLTPYYPAPPLVVLYAIRLVYGAMKGVCVTKEQEIDMGATIAVNAIGPAWILLLGLIVRGLTQ